MNAEVQEVRAARVDEAEDVLQTLCAAFGLDADAARPIFYSDPFFDLTNKRILTDSHNEIVSCLTLIPSNIRVGGVVVPMTGVAGVATRPERQNRGCAGMLIGETLTALARENSAPLAALFADRSDYYRKFGWETASRGSFWRSPASAWAHDNSPQAVRPAQADDAAALRALHVAASKNRTGASARDARRWRVIEEFAPGREIWVSEDKNGYLFLERTTDGATHLHELCAQTPEAERALHGFLGRQPGEIFWTARTDEATVLPRGTCDGDAPGIMIRLVNLRDALRRLHAAHFADTLAETGASLTLRADDTLLPYNQTPLRLDTSGVSEADCDSPHCLHGDIRIFARLYLGDLTPSEACAAGLLHASSPCALALADRLFPARHPFVAIPDQF